MIEYINLIWHEVAFIRIHLHTRVPNQIKFYDLYVNLMYLKEQENPFEDIDNVTNKTCVNPYPDLQDLIDKIKRIFVNVKYSKDYIED